MVHRPAAPMLPGWLMRQDDDDAPALSGSGGDRSNIVKLIMHRMLNTAVKAARKAGIITRSSSDPETHRPAQAERLPRGRPGRRGRDHPGAARCLPDHGFLAEESGYRDRDGIPGGDRSSTAPPISSTASQFCVSIGLLHKGVEAVIFDPNRNGHRLQGRRRIQ
jgi:hypothetical protein